MSHSDILVLKKIIKYCNDIDELTTRFGNDYEKYCTDVAFQYSCNMCIIQIGELVSRLSKDFIAVYNEVPWHAIKAMRNLHAHDYENVDMEIVWNTLQEDIPKLKTQLEYILENIFEFPDFTDDFFKDGRDQGIAEERDFFDM